VSNVADASLSVADHPAARLSVNASGRSGHGDATGDAFVAAVERLFHERFAGLRRYIHRLAGDAALADDIAQDAFTRLFDRGTMPDEPVAWLITVAVNLLRDDRRKSGRRLRLLQGANDSVGHSAAAADPADSLIHTERRQQVRTALDHLTLRDRQALLLRHSGFSYREIAVALHMPEVSVGTTLVRAGAAFREFYQELHGEPD
jgi:RNA polymerase sigma-70 factor (ECF subfamily)